MTTPQIDHVDIGAGRRLRVRRWPGEGRPLVLLHGLLDDSEGWAQLAADSPRPAIAIDLPGFGGSSQPQLPRIGSYANDVVRGLRALEVRECVLVGHSLGGAVASAVCSRTPEVGALALLAPAGFGRIRLAELVAMRGVVDVAERALPLALLNPLVCTAAYSTFVAHGRLPSRDLVDRLRRRAWRSGPGVRAAVEAISHAGRDPRGPVHRPLKFDGPVAVLWGERDALVPRSHIRAVRIALPQAHVEVWPGMGHHPQRERPHQLALFVEEHAGRAERVGGPVSRRKRPRLRRVA